MHAPVESVAPRRTYKREAIASAAVVASNHPLASAAGAEVLASGGNAVDAAVATLFALSVVEPMMVSPFGAGFFLVRDGRTGDVVFIDNYASVPAGAHPTLYDPIPAAWTTRRSTALTPSATRQLPRPVPSRAGRMPWSTMAGYGCHG